jgi:AraC family transcriptional regulator
VSGWLAGITIAFENAVSSCSRLVKSQHRLAKTITPGMTISIIGEGIALDPAGSGASDARGWPPVDLPRTLTMVREMPCRWENTVMTDVRSIRAKLGERFRQDEPPTLASETLPHPHFAVSLVGCEGVLGKTKTGPREDAFMVGLAVRECETFHYSAHGLPTVTSSVRVSDVMVHDLSRDPEGDIASPFQSLMFYTPMSVFDWVADASQAPVVEALFLPPGSSRADPRLQALGQLLLSVFEKPGEASKLFIDHLLLAAAAHIVHEYGGMRRTEPSVRGGLATWQKRRAQELLRANLSGELALEQLASECGLSLSHFSRAFRASMGVPPHQWLQLCRIDRAKHLLRGRDLPLSQVGLACGFSDQSHFTRAFTKATGTSPGAWRRQFVQAH